jgi:hypothetical protein
MRSQSRIASRLESGKTAIDHAQGCTAEQDSTGVQWRSLCIMQITGVMAINGDPSRGNIWITGVCWRYL